MKRIISFISCVFILPLIIHAQSVENNTIIRNRLNNMFSDLEKNRVPTRLLLDYAVDLVDLRNFNGKELNDSNRVSVNEYELILRSIASARVAGTDLININNYIQNFIYPSNYSKYNINIGMAFYVYNFIKPNALEDGLIQYDPNSEKVSDVYNGDTWVNPYDEALVFAFSPNVNTCHVGDRIFYRFLGTNILCNKGRTSDLLGFYFDAGDGNGFQKVGVNASLSIKYTEPGPKTLKMRVISASKGICDAHALMYVADNPNTMTRSADAQPDTSLVINGATASIYYSPESGNQVKKPFIFVEGFDPNNLLKISNPDISDTELHKGINSWDNFYKIFKESLLYDSYDFIYIDWHDGTKSLYDNTSVLKNMIQRINELKSISGSEEKNIIMGHSMGGLISRMALCEMEFDDISHQTTVYVSYDSPHLGANLPLGVQYIIPQILSFAKGKTGLATITNLLTDGLFSDAENILLDVLHSPAAQQMLMKYLNPSGIIDSYEHNMLLDYLEGCGMPQGDTDSPITNLAISNGASFNLFPELYNNEHYLYADGKAYITMLGHLCGLLLSGATGYLFPMLSIAMESSLLVDFSLGWQHIPFTSSKYSIHMEVNPYGESNAGGKLSQLKVTYKKIFLWLFTIWENQIFSDIKYVPQNEESNYDYWPGSYYILNDDIISENMNQYGGIYYYNVDFGLGRQFMFIPTASSLAIKTTSGHVTNSSATVDYYTNNPTPLDETPFHAYYLDNIAHGHMFVEDSMLNWINQNINISILGNTLGKTGTMYFLRGYFGIPQWSTSDESIATISPSGMLTVKKPGNVDIIAQIYDNGKSYYKKKRIMVGFPDMYLKYRYMPDMGYIVNALPVVEENEALVDSLVNSGGLCYEWGIKTGEGSIQWTTSDSRTFSVGIPESSVNTTVYMKLRQENDFGTTYSVTFQQQLPFTTNYSHVVVNGTQVNDIYFVKQSGTFDPINSAADYTVTYNYVALYPEDNANISPSLKLKGNNCYLKIPGTTTLLTGVKQGMNWAWKFSFFDSPYFLNNLDWVQNGAGGSTTYHRDCNMIICNSEQEEMQLVPFQIIYDPGFGQ